MIWYDILCTFKNPCIIDTIYSFWVSYRTPAYNLANGIFNLSFNLKGSHIIDHSKKNPSYCHYIELHRKKFHYIFVAKDSTYAPSPTKERFASLISWATAKINRHIILMECIINIHFKQIPFIYLENHIHCMVRMEIIRQDRQISGTHLQHLHLHFHPI